jgi:hypothetical protein
MILTATTARIASTVEPTPTSAAVVVETILSPHVSADCTELIHSTH